MKKMTKILIIVIAAILTILLLSSCSSNYRQEYRKGVIVKCIKPYYLDLGKYRCSYVVVEDGNPEKQLISRLNTQDVFVDGDTLCWTVNVRINE